jgi:hypothetical protein
MLFLGAIQNKLRAHFCARAGGHRETALFYSPSSPLAQLQVSDCAILQSEINRFVEGLTFSACIELGSGSVGLEISFCGPGNPAPVLQCKTPQFSE